VNKLAKLDHKYLWHPFTQMRDWLKHEPVTIIRGKGPYLFDAHGKRYLDGNSSIWTNLHGHAHPKINAAINAQLKKIAHSSALGFANEPASILGERLVKAAGGKLNKVFYSDDGSTAMEVALKLSFQYARRTGFSKNPRFLSLDNAYHGDTVGAVSLGHIDLFHKAYQPLLFKADKIASPYCYRCPHNRAKPERTDARDCRKCNMECLDAIDKKFHVQKKKDDPYAAFAFEPLMQGAAGMIAQPKGWLSSATKIAKSYGAQLIADEIMTGFGRTGTMFACQKENVQPDFTALAKGLTGGYLPMAATLTTQKVFDAFLGKYEEFKTFFHGHSYTANQLGSAAALTSLELLDRSKNTRSALERFLEQNLQTLWSIPQVGDIRRVGLVAGVELVRDWKTRQPYDLRERAGIRVCESMAKRGVLTRPIGNVIVIMPPYCTTADQVAKICDAVCEAIRESL
jgi:adenosylmethionine-8-amino-7-oxononanoate aminotransferase